MWCGASTCLCVVRRCPTLPHPLECSTIGAVGLSFRVRNGTGRFPHAMTTVTRSPITSCLVWVACWVLLEQQYFIIQGSRVPSPTIVWWGWSQGDYLLFWFPNGLLFGNHIVNASTEFYKLCVV